MIAISASTQSTLATWIQIRTGAPDAMKRADAGQRHVDAAVSRQWREVLTPAWALGRAAVMTLAIVIAGSVVMVLTSVTSAGAAARYGGDRGHNSHSRGHAAAQRGSAPLGGINIGGISARRALSAIDREVASARRLHAKLVRVEMPWAAFEPNGAGKIDRRVAAAAGRLVGSAAKSGIKVIAMVDRTPCWASSAPPALMHGCVPGESLGGAQAWPPRNPSDYADFLGWLAGRYGKDLAAIEVWNEPDQINQHYFRGKNKPRRYAALVRAAYPAIKRADPHVKVLAGSLVGSNGAFMNALYRAGMKGYYDGVAVHFYTLGLAALRDFREDQLRHGDHTPLWLDEFGWSSCWPKQKIQQEQGCVTEKVQAQNIADTFRELAHTRWVAAMTTYDLQDTPHENFGVLDAKGARKPSFGALARVLRRPYGQPSPVRLELRREGGQVIAEGSAPIGDYMRLEAFRNGRRRYEATFTLNRFNRYRLKLPRALGRTGLTVRVWQYWMGRNHAQQRRI